LVGGRVGVSDFGLDGGDWGRIGGFADYRLDDVGSAVHRGRGRGFGAVGDFDAAGEFGQEASDVFFDLGRAFGAVEAEGAGLAFLQDGTVGDLPKVVGGQAVGCRVREHILVPAILEIGVEAITRRVALRESKQSVRRLIRNQGNIVKDFQENVRDLDGVAGRADAIVDPALVRNVRVVLLVQIPAVPAALEVDLRAHAGFAFGAVHVRLLDDDIVDAVEADSVGNGATRVIFVAVGHCRVVVAAGGFVAGENHEAFGEGHGLGDIWAAAEIVDDGAVVADFDEGAVGVSVVERRRPVGRFVGADFA
jgi:hypothetical protein